MKRNRMISIVVSLCFLVPTISYALSEKEVLAGLKGVLVLVEDIGPDVESLGLTRSQIETDTELRLRKAGIKVMDKNESLNTPGSPYLYININYIKLKTRPIFAYWVIIELREMVKLMRQNNSSYDHAIQATIWRSGMIGKADTDILIREIRAVVADKVDNFINQYLAANPKLP